MIGDISGAPNGCLVTKDSGGNTMDIHTEEKLIGYGERPIWHRGPLCPIFFLY